MSDKAKLGSVSSGTLRPEDLIPAFIDTLDDIRERISLPGPTTETTESVQHRKETVTRLDTLLGEIEDRMNSEDYYESENAMEDLEALADTLGEFAPPFAYFGAHEGDGADFGFWLSNDAIEEAIHSGEIVKVPSGDDWPKLPPEAEYVLEVSDHGNLSLYPRDRREEVWSVV